MTSPAHSDVSENSLHLWALAFPPSIWAAHFLLSYVAASLWCGAVERGAPLGPVGVGFAVLTVIALAGIAAMGWGGWRRYKVPNQNGLAVPSHHRDTPGDRHRFLGLATALLAALSAIATIYVALAVAIVSSCS